MIEELPIPQAWEWLALRELSSVVHGLAAQGFDSPADLIARLNDISEAIAQVYQGEGAAVFQYSIDPIRAEELPVGADALIPAPPPPYSQRRRKQLRLPFTED